MTAAAAKPAPRLGRYEILKLLAVGGMAEIFLARVNVAQFDKLVVIKRMLPHLARDPMFVAMFLREARLTATFDHPNIAHVLDMGTEDGVTYYAMEYVRGTDLRGILRAATLARVMIPLDCVIAIAIAMCAGLDFAHDQTDAEGNALDVIHRDISPSNVLLSYEGAIKVSDFGVAKVKHADQRTRTGSLKGKVGYMSPEQCRGEPLDRRSDIFAIGIVLFELVTRSRLFAAESEFAAMEAIVRAAVPAPSTRRTDCPPELDAIVLKALERDRDKRYATAREMQRALEAFARTAGLAITSTAVSTVVAELIPQSKTPTRRVPTVEALGASTTAVLDGGASSPDDFGEDATTSMLGHEPSLAIMIDGATGVPSVKPSRARWLVVIGVLGAGGAAAAIWRPWEPRESPPPTTPTPELVPDRVAAVPIDVAAVIPDGSEQVPPDASVPDRAPIDAGTKKPPKGPPKARDAGVPVATLPPIDAAPIPVAPIDAAPRVIAPPDAAPVVLPPSKGSLQATPKVAISIDGLTESEIQRGLDRVGANDALKRCYHTAAAGAAKTIADSVLITFEVDESRAPRKVKASGAALPGLAACAAQVAGQVRTNSAPDTGNARVTLDIHFTPVP